MFDIGLSETKCVHAGLCKGFNPGGAIHSPPKYTFIFLKPASLIKVLNAFFMVYIINFWFLQPTGGTHSPFLVEKLINIWGDQRNHSRKFMHLEIPQKTFLQYKYLLETWTILILAVSVLSSRTIQLLGIELNFRISIKLICTPPPVMHSFYRICAQG